MDAELNLLEKARREESVAALMDNGLIPHFVRWRTAAQAIVEHHLNFSAVIPVEELTRKDPSWPALELDQTPLDQPMEFYLEAFKTVAIHAGVTDLLSDVAQKLRGTEPRDAVDALRKGILELDDLRRSAREVDLVRSGLSRWEEYLRRKEMDGVIGVPFPWDSLTEQTGGMQRGTVTALVGRTGIGKSMACMLAAEKARAVGQKPLIFPLEMTDIQWGVRWDAHRLRLPFEDIRLGRLDDAREKAYQEALLREVSEEEPGYFVITDDEHASMSGITAKIEEYRPDIVIIDGIYLMHDDQGGEGWEALKNISNGLKKLARRKDIPFFVTTQFTSEVGKTKMDCDVDRDIAYGKALRQDCDNILAIFQDQDLEDAGQMLMRLKKFREGRPMELLLNWNWNTNNFSEASMLGGEVAAPSGETEDIGDAPPPQPPSEDGSKSVDF